MPRTGVAARLLSNSRWNFIAFAVAVLANLVTLPIAIAAIGLDHFGAVGLILALYAPFTLLGTVIGQALVRELAPRLAANDREGCVRIMSAAALLCLLGTLVVMPLLWLTGDSLMHFMTGHERAVADWSAALLICGIGWTVQQACLLLQSAMAATQQFGRLAIAGTIGAIASASAVVCASRWMPNALGFLVGSTLGFGLTLILLLSLLWSELGWLFRFRRWQSSDLRALLHFGKWQGAAHFVGALGNQVDRYALGVMAPLAVVGQFNVAMRLQEVVHMGVLKLTEVLFPHFSVTTAEPMAQRANFYRRSSWLLNVAGVVTIAPLIPLADSLLTLWVSPAAAEGGSAMLRTLAVAGVFGCGANVYTFFAMATGQAHKLAAVALAHATTLILGTVVLIWWLGPAAAGVGYLVANALRLVIVTRFSQDYFAGNGNPGTMSRSTVPALVGGLATACLLAVIPLPLTADWVSLGVEYVLVALLVCTGALAATAVTGDGRHLIRDACVYGQHTLFHRP